MSSYVCLSAAVNAITCTLRGLGADLYGTNLDFSKFEISHGFQVCSIVPGQLLAISHGSHPQVMPAQLPHRGSGSSIFCFTLVKVTPWTRAAKIRTETNSNSSSAAGSRAGIQQRVFKETNSPDTRKGKNSNLTCAM